SPLTLVQERLLQTPQTQVRLLFLSRASGLAHIDEALEALIDSGRTNGSIDDYLIPQELRGGKDILSWLRAFRKRQPQGSHALLIQNVTNAKSSDLLSQIGAAQSYCRNVTQNRQTTLQVVFVLDPAAGWAWMQNDVGRRAQIEDGAAMQMM